MLWSVRRLWFPLGDTHQSCESRGTHIMVRRVWTAGLLLEVCLFMSARGTLVFSSLAMNVVCHEVVCLRIRAKHMNFYVFAVYRNPGADDSLLDYLLTAMSEVQQTDRKSSFVFVGDFNAHHRERLGSVSQTDAHGRALLDFATSSSCQQLVAEPTHSAGNPLDLVLTDVPGVVSVVVSPPVGSSDHSTLLLSLNVDQPVMDLTVVKEVYVKTGIIWANVQQMLSLCRGVMCLVMISMLIG